MDAADEANAWRYEQAPPELREGRDERARQRARTLDQIRRHRDGMPDAS